MVKKSICLVLFPLVYGALAVLLVISVMKSGLWPGETGAMYPLYCGDLLYTSLAGGGGFPLYDTMWFAGSETLRFFGPLPAALLAGCQALAAGDNIAGGYLFLGLLCFAAACAWLWMGCRAARPVLGGLLGIVWFFSPYNLHVLLVQGDLARSLAYCALPLLFFMTRDYLKAQDWKKLPFFGVMFLLLALTHPGCGALAAFAWAVYLVLWRLVYHTGAGIGGVVLSAASGVLAAGLWLAPYFMGGAARGAESETMAASFQPLLDSLNVFNYWSDSRSAVYFGLALLIACVIMGVFGRRESTPEAWAAIALLVCTTTVSCAAAGILPGSALFRGVWLFSAAASLGLLALLNWGTVIKPVTVLLVLLLAADALPGWRLTADPSGARVPAEERLAEVAAATLREEAQSVTAQRLAILDEDALGPMGAYLAADWENPVAILGGVGRDQSPIGENLTRLDRALRDGGYLYVFDRCLAWGCDSVLLDTALVKDEDLAAGLLDQAADRLGYALTEEKGTYRLYHRDLGSGWGTAASYPAIGIGTTAGYTSIVYPAMEETADPNLNHYTFEDLSGYELVFLSGFTYDDRETAEELVLRLSRAGVHVVIAADGIPLDKRTHGRSFLGVICNDVSFSNGYPELDTVDGVLNTKLFPPGYSKWSTVYVEGLDDVWGSVLDNDLELPFYGTVENDHIVVVGLNLHYFYALTKDENVGKLLDRGMALPAGRLPERAVVPVEVSYASGSITLTTDYDGVGTALSFHDGFAGQGVRDENHMAVVDRGTTVIHLQYPYFKTGLACTGAGVLLLSVIPLIRRRNQRAEEREKAETE